MKWKAASTAAVVLLAVAEGAWAQPAPEQSGPPERRGDGWRILNMSVYAGYISTALPDANFNYLSGTVPLGADMQTGASLSVGWRRHRPRSNILFTYNPSFYGLVEHSEWNSLNHALSFRAERKLGNNWNITVSTAG